MTRGLALAGIAVGVAVAALLWLLREPAPSPPATATRDAGIVVHRVHAPAMLPDGGSAEAPLGRGAAIHGHLREHGKPVAGFDVGLRTHFAHGITDAQGAYRIDAIPAGAYTVVAEDRHTGRRASASVELAPGDELELDLELIQTGHLRVVVVDADGNPIVGAGVTITGPAAAWSYNATDRMSTDEDGAIDRLGLTTGPVLIAAVAGIVQQEQTFLMRGGDQTARIAFPMHGGKVIAGHVVDDRGVPVPGAYVRAERFGGNLSRTAADGSFRFDRLLEGTYTVSATRREYERWLTTTTIATGTEDAVVVAPRDGRLVAKVAGFSGRTMVSIYSDGVALTGMPDPDETWDALRPGDYHVVAEDDAGRVGSVDAQVKPDETTNVRVIPSATGSVRVAAVHFPDGAAVSDAHCRAPAVEIVATDARGEALLEHVPPGKNRIDCVAMSGVGHATVTVEHDGVAAIRVWLVTGAARPDESHLGAHLDPATSTFTQVDAGGPAATAGIAVGDRLLAIEGTDATGADAEAASAFVLSHATPYRVRVRARGATYAVDLTVTPR